MRVALFLLLASVSVGAGSPLVATRADETSPATNGRDVAWTQGSRDGPVIVMKLGTVMLQHGVSRPAAITAPGVLAASGGMDRRTLVVQVVRGGQSDLRLFDLASRRFRDPPRGVNTRAWEWRGSILGARLLFGRYRVAGNAGTYDVLLANLATGRIRMLDSVAGHVPYAEPGQIAGPYAVWSTCRDNLCFVYRYDARDARRIRIDGGYGDGAYAPSVTATGDVYYARGRYACGSDVEIVRYRAGERSVIARLPEGFDLRFTDTDGSRLLYDRVNCTHGDFDIYSIRVGRY
jgi:hypothetical protein